MTKDRRKEQLINQIEGRCHHFNGMSNTTCAAGINYQELAGIVDGLFLVLPCAKESTWSKTRREQLGLQIRQCPKLDRVTREQAEKEAEEMINQGNRTMSAMIIAHEDADSKGLKKGHGGAGEVECPICITGHIQYSVASYNGHMAAKCTTKGCVSWME